MGINPSFVSATASGIALLLGIFLLQESNPRVLARKGVKDVVNGKVAGDAEAENAATPTVVAPSANGEPEKVDVPAQTS